MLRVFGSPGFFYQDLFTACPVDLGVQSVLLNCLTLSLSVDDAASCDGPISPNEAHVVLLGTAKGKSPGSDGLPMEFYVVFWDLLGGDLVNVFNASLEARVLAGRLLKVIATVVAPDQTCVPGRYIGEECRLFTRCS